MATTTDDSATSSSSTFSLGSTIAIGAATGVVAGLLANVLRKGVVQAPTALAGSWDKALAAEHAAALKIFDLIEATDDSSTAKRSFLLMQLKHAVGKHAFQEENVVYPMLRDQGLKEAADQLNHEHGYVKQYFFDLTEMAKDDPAWLPKVRAFRSDIQRHMREEENELFPKLRDQLSEEQNKHVTFAMNKEGLKLA